MGEAGKGKIWLFDNGLIGDAAGGFETRGPNGYNSSETVSVSVGDTISFTCAGVNYDSIKTLVTKKTINAKGKKLHLIAKTKCSDYRSRNCWFYAYASQAVTDTTDVPGNGNEIAQFFPDGDGEAFYIPYNNKQELETELVIPITQDHTYVAVGFLKKYIFVNYAKITQIWVE